MDALSSFLQPYKHIIAKSAELVTMLQMFSGVFICWDIYKQKSTRGNDVFPFLIGLVMGSLHLNYGLILKDPSMIQSNFWGLLLTLGYLTVYIKYSKDRKPVWKKIGIASGISGAVIIYTQLEDPSLVQNRFGMIMMCFMMYMIAMPIYALKDVIKNKCTEGMPFPILVSGTVVGFSWLLHAICLNNKMLVFQNFIMFFIFAFQLSFFAIYPNRREDSEEQTKKAE